MSTRVQNQLGPAILQYTLTWTRSRLHVCIISCIHTFNFCAINVDWRAYSICHSSTYLARVALDNKCSPPTIHTHPHHTKPAQLHRQHWLRQFISNNYNYDRSTYPNVSQRSLRNRHKSLTHVAYLYHPSDTTSQITTARPCGRQH